MHPTLRLLPFLLWVVLTLLSHPIEAATFHRLRVREENPEFDQLSAWERYPEIAAKWEKHPLTPEQYREALRTDDRLYKLSERRATFLHHLALLPGVRDGPGSLLMVAAGTGEQLPQVPGASAFQAVGFKTVYFTDGSLGFVDFAWGLMQEILTQHRAWLDFQVSEHPSLKYSADDPEDERMAIVVRITAPRHPRKQEPDGEQYRFGPETWVGTTFVFLQAWSHQLPAQFRGVHVDVVADIWGLCSFQDAEGYARDLKAFHDKHQGALYVGYLEHGVLRGNGRVNDALYKVREQHFDYIACDPARDMETIVGKKTCHGDYSLQVFKNGPQFYWFLYPRSGFPARGEVDFVPKIVEQEGRR